MGYFLKQLVQLLVLHLGMLFATTSMALVEIQDAQIVDITPSGLSVVWVASESSAPRIEIYSDSAGANTITSDFEVTLFPLYAGDPAVTDSYGKSIDLDALRSRSQTLGLMKIQVQGLQPATNYYLHVYSDATGNTAQWPLGLPAQVTTPSLNEFVANSNQMLVTVNEPDPRGWLVLAKSSETMHGVSAIVGDGGASNEAFIDLTNLFDLNGNNWEPTGQKQITLELKSGWDANASQIIDLDLQSSFSVSALYAATVMLPGSTDTDGDGIPDNLDLDDDNDGLSDIWEMANGTNPLIDDSSLDLDGDTFNNAYEFAAGSDPDDIADKPLGANGISYVYFKDHFSDGQYDDRWYIENAPTGAVYSLFESGTVLDITVQQPASGCNDLQLHSFSAIDAVNMVYHAIISLDGFGVTRLGFMDDKDTSNRIEVEFDNDSSPYLVIRSADAGVQTEIPVTAAGPFNSTAVDIKFVKAGQQVSVFVNGAIQGSVANIGIGNQVLRPYSTVESCSDDVGFVDSKVDLIEILVDRDADGLADVVEDANINGIVDAGESDPQNPDMDNDTILDGFDNCSFAANTNQQDSGGIATTAPDGIGDACQCGDVNNNGIVDNTDAIIIKRYVLGLPPGVDINKCSVNAGNSCDNTDAILIQRAVLGLPPGVSQGCAAAGAAP